MYKGSFRPRMSGPYKEKLFCPVCREPDHNNTINGIHICFNCMCQLVPQSELKNYNRAWRRSYRMPLGAKKK